MGEGGGAGKGMGVKGGVNLAAFTLPVLVSVSPGSFSYDFREPTWVRQLSCSAPHNPLNGDQKFRQPSR